MEKLFGEEVFSYPKPSELIKILIKISTNSKSNDIILDFFAGSGTTGDAVMQLNAEDGGNRKFILIQLPENIDSKKNLTTYNFIKNELKIKEPTIFEITKERLLRAAKKINEELDERSAFLKAQNTFKIYSTIPNNEGPWKNYYFEMEELDPQVKLFDVSTLSEQHLSSLLITWKTYDGIPLTEDAQAVDLQNYIAYYCESKLYLMAKNFTTKNLKALLEKIDADRNFNPSTIIAFGYQFESKILREIAENINSYANKKELDINFIERY